jgi:hypothetical protein
MMARAWEYGSGLCGLSLKGIVNITTENIPIEKVEAATG